MYKAQNATNDSEEAISNGSPLIIQGNLAPIYDIIERAAKRGNKNTQFSIYRKGDMSLLTLRKEGSHPDLYYNIESVKRSLEVNDFKVINQDDIYLDVSWE